MNKEFTLPGKMGDQERLKILLKAFRTVFAKISYPKTMLNARTAGFLNFTTVNWNPKWMRQYKNKSESKVFINNRFLRL